MHSVWKAVKEFIKPNAEKLVIFVVMFTLCFFFLGLCVFALMMGGVTPGVKPSSGVKLVVLTWVIFNWPLYIGLIQGKFAILFLLLDWLWLYVFSCLIFSIVNKIKIKHKK